jgi:hypothetical protein
MIVSLEACLDKLPTSSTFSNLKSLYWECFSFKLLITDAVGVYNLKES